MTLGAIQLDNLHLTLGDKQVLNNVSTHFNAGELTVLLGPNGTGKSSLLKVICQECDGGGTEQFFSKQAHQWQPEQLAKHLGILPQSSSLSFNFRVAEVVELGGLPLSASQADITRIAERNMRQTDVWHLAQRRYPSLSGGEKQRVHLARILTQLEQAGEQKILLLDEPTAALDLCHQHNTLRLAKQLVGQGCAVVIVMHDLNLAAQYADRMLILNKGEIAADGSPWQVLTPTNIAEVYQWQVNVIPHPQHGYPVILSCAA